MSTNLGMDLWKDSHQRCHANSNPSVPPNFNKAWPRGFERRSVEMSDGAFAESRGGGAEEAETVEVPDGFALQDEREIGKQNRDEALKAIESNGIDAVALYAPVHFFGDKKWGVYIHERRFFGLCFAIHEELGGRTETWDGLVADLHKVLLRHEYFHSAVELFALMFEDVAGPLDDSTCAYKSYFDSIYTTCFPETDCLEESLATASEFCPRFSTVGFTRALKSITLRMPIAYSNWRKYARANEYQKGEQALAAEIRQNAEQINRHSGDSIGIWPSLSYAQIRNCQAGVGNVWFPFTEPRSLDQFGPVPRWIHHSGGVVSRRTLKKEIGVIAMKEFLRALKRTFDASWEPGGKENRISIPKIGKFSYSKSASQAPRYLARQIARKMGVSERDLLKQLGLA